MKTASKKDLERENSLLKLLYGVSTKSWGNSYNNLISSSVNLFGIAISLDSAIAKQILSSFASFLIRV